MTINTGVIEMYVAGQVGGVTARIYYNPVLTSGEVVAANQPIRNVGGVALEVINTTGQEAVITVDGPSGPFLGTDGSRDVKVPPAGLTATAAQLRNAAGIQTRADVAGFSLSSP